MNIIGQVLFNVFGVGVCLLALCGLQWAFFELTKNAMPHPFKQTEFKQKLANSLYQGYKSNKNDKSLNPFGQHYEQDKANDTDNYDSTPAGLFSSTWTHFILLLELVKECIIRRLSTKSKQNLCQD